jgi:uncharacterized membrane protein YphA (DoxX/SURF4 family)
MKKIFSPSPLWQANGIAFLRILVGILLAYHGAEVFQEEKMKPYFEWEVFKNFSSPSLMPYLGKSAELIGGILLLLGLFTRIACIIIAGTMLYICFFVGKGEFWYGDQHPFLFVILALVFFFTCPRNLSLDKFFF